MFRFGAAERTRTSTSLRSLVPETSVYTNFTTAAYLGSPWPWPGNQEYCKVYGLNCKLKGICWGSGPVVLCYDTERTNAKSFQLFDSEDM